MCLRVSFAIHKILEKSLMTKTHKSKSCVDLISKLFVGVKSWKFRRLVILTSVDLTLVAFSFWLSFVLRFDDLFFVEYRDSFQGCLPILCSAYFVAYLLGGIYQQVWRFANFESVLIIAKACIAGALIFQTSKYIILPKVVLPRSIFALQMLLTFLSTAGVRYCWRMLVIRAGLRKNQKQSQRCVIYGAGVAGEMLTRFIRQSPTFSYKLVGFIDDNPDKKSHKIHGYKILGTGDDLLEISQKYKAEVLILAMPSLSGRKVRKILKIAEKANLKPLIMPDIESSLGDNIYSLRRINEKDLLKRAPKPTDYNLIKDIFQDQTVLVTGGGGSIGSEICKQVLRFRPRILIIYDASEYNLYSIDHKLKKIGCEGVQLIPILGSVTDELLVNNTIHKYRPSIILHAAAYKHVPIVEQNPIEGVKNNIGGTLGLAKAALRYDVEKFILISTDKAVNSTNIMGHTKRCCELIIQSLQKRENGKTQFSAVRFGNVLGSSGSVIPLFLSQIKDGGPVTVTSKDVTRYFMLVEEAVGLVLQTLLKSKGGEVFVLDMGEPVKIYEMAKQLILLNGKRPYKDIDIEITGLRSGEKLYEELSIEGAEQTTLHSYIYITKPTKVSSRLILEEVDELLALSKTNNDQKVINKLLEISSDLSKKEEKSQYSQTSLPVQVSENTLQ